MSVLARSQSLLPGRVGQTALRHAFSRPKPLWNALRTYVTRRSPEYTQRWPTGSVEVTMTGQFRRQSTLPPKKTEDISSPYINVITSLNPGCLVAKKQEIFKPETYKYPVIVRGEDTLRPGKLLLTYVKIGKTFTPFPSGTRGVFYFHHVEGDNINSQLRFRLCHNIDEFTQGSDLQLPDGQTWARSLQLMTRLRRSFSPLLALISAEFPIAPAQVDSSLTCHRVITTLCPRDFVSKHQDAFDLSRHAFVIFTPASGGGFKDNTPVFYKQEMNKPDNIFPPDTMGFLYYKQSLTYPTEVGELRFRLCRNSSMFDEGSDLLLPSGIPWFRSSHCLRHSAGFRGLVKILYQDGLLLLPGSSTQGAGHFTESSERRPLLARLSQPFVLDLAYGCSKLALSTGPSLEPVVFPLRIWNRHFSPQSCYRGRLLVQLEEHPTSKWSPISSRSRPVIQMRVLELLTPVVRVSESEIIARPEPGQLFTVLWDGRYAPWTYKPRGRIREAFSKLIEPSDSMQLL